jgi:MscS family membrane protein
MEKQKSVLLKTTLETINQKRKLLNNSLLWGFFLLLLCPSVNAQQDTTEVRNNPYNVIYNHLANLQNDNYEPEIAALSFPDSANKAEELAIQLKQILDGKGLYIDLNRIPTSENFTDSLSGDNIYILDKSEPRIYLEKQDGNWTYSRTTVQQIPSIHKSIFPFGTALATKFNAPVWQFKFLGIKIWKWLGLLILVVLSQIVFLLVKRISNIFISQFLKRKIEITQEVQDSLLKLSRTLGLILSVRFILFLLPMFQIAPKLNAQIIKTLNVLSIFFIIITIKHIIKILFVYFGKITEKTENTLDDQLLPVLYKLSMIIVWALGIIYILDYMGVNVTALLAGISIGGLALALAAQDTVKNFFGSIMIFLDKPFQIGDLVEFEGTTGSIEEVGVRSTRIRTVTNSLMYVPNARIADSVINNLGLRVFRRFYTELGVTYDTSPALIEKFVEGIRKIIEMHPLTVKDRYEVHLNSFASSSLNIILLVFFDTRDWSIELKSRHELMVAVIRLAEAIGVRFAFPTQTLHIEEMPQLGSANTPAPQSHEDADTHMTQFLGEIESYFAERQKPETDKGLN